MAIKRTVMEKACVSELVQTGLLVTIDTGIRAKSPRRQFHTDHTINVTPEPQNKPMIVDEFQGNLFSPY